MAINPEQLTARAIYNILKLPSAMKIETFTVKKGETLTVPMSVNGGFAMVLEKVEK